MIEGVVVTKLPQFVDERGAVFKFLNSESVNFKTFGEAYFSIINQDVIKGWKYHKIANQNFSVPYGMIKFVLYDDRDDSPTKGEIEEIILDDFENYKLLTLPSKLWYSFKCISDNKSILANISDILHDQTESLNIDFESKIIPYEW